MPLKLCVSNGGKMWCESLNELRTLKQVLEDAKNHWEVKRWDPVTAIRKAPAQVSYTLTQSFCVDSSGVVFVVGKHNTREESSGQRTVAVMKRVAVKNGDVTLKPNVPSCNLNLQHYFRSCFHSIKYGEIQICLNTSQHKYLGVNITKIGDIVAVSYTHLDVYKRQGSIPATPYVLTRVKYLILINKVS